MISARAVVSILALAVATSCTPIKPQEGAGASEADVGSVLATITPPLLKAHLDFLADDLLEGRATGTRGYDIAARHVATTLEAMGLEPAGDAGGFLQRVPLLETTSSPATTITLEQFGSTPYRLTPEDFITSGNPLEASVRLGAPLVFRGLRG